MYFVVQTDGKDRRFINKYRAEKEFEKRVVKLHESKHKLFQVRNNGHHFKFEILKKHND